MPKTFHQFGNNWQFFMSFFVEDKKLKKTKQ